MGEKVGGGTNIGE